VILKLLVECLNLDGDVVEFGCYEGDTSIKMGKLIKNKRLWLYDSFEGLPEKSDADASSVGNNFKTGELKASKNAVMKRFLHASLTKPIIKKAWFDELDPENDLPEKIAFALLDGDYYESIKISLHLVTPKMTKEGIIIVHDYRNEALPGAAKAVDEFISKNPTWRIRIQQGLAIIQQGK
jgi:O-methyltransferase